MADEITKIAQNPDGVWVLNFTFDNGSGITTNTAISIPSADTVQAARDSAIEIAKSLKADWLHTLQNNECLGPVTL